MMIVMMMIVMIMMMMLQHVRGVRGIMVCWVATAKYPLFRKVLASTGAHTTYFSISKGGFFRG